MDAEFHGVPFETYIVVENLYQGFLSTQKDALLDDLAHVLYPGCSATLSPEERISIFYWVASLKDMFARRFPDFFQPATANAEKLEELRINEGVEAITNSMCYGDKGLLKLYLPSTVKTIDVGAFDACSNLAEFHIRAVTPPVAETGAFGVMFPNYKMNLYVPVGALDAYKAAPEWDDAFLTYNEEGEQTGVEDVAASKQVASVEYYSVSGIKNAEPVDGVNIKVVRYTDGSLQTSKFVK